MAIVVLSKKTAISVCLIPFFILITIAGSARQATVNLKRQVIIEAPTISLHALLHQVTQQTGARFSINTRRFPAQKIIQIHTHRQSLQNWLQQLHGYTGIYYAILGDHIILLDNPPARSKQPSATVTRHRLPEPVKKALSKQIAPVYIQKSTSLRNISPGDTTITFNKDTTVQVTTMPKIDSGITNKKDSVIKKRPAAKPAATMAGNYAAAVSNDHEKKGILSEAFIKGGIAANDVFYANAMAQAGIPYLYGIIGYGTNFKLSGLQYGAGLSIPLNDNWKIHGQFTTGKLSPTSDSGMLHWQFKTTLFRAGIMAEINIGNRFKLQFGPVVNIMKLRFYANGINTSPGLTWERVTTKFNLIKPVYTLSNNYNVNRANSTIVWIGLQVNFFYSLNFFKRE